MIEEYTYMPLPKQFPPFELCSIFGPVEWDKFLKDLRVVERTCGENSNDRLAALIAICIENEIDTMGYIIHVLVPFGYKRGHVAIILKSWTGRNRDRHLWFVDAAGKYHSLPNTIFAAA